jgi:ABC-type polysaccharide transport system permease subunit
MSGEYVGLLNMLIMQFTTEKVNFLVKQQKYFDFFTCKYKFASEEII